MVIFRMNVIFNVVIFIVGFRLYWDKSKKRDIILGPTKQIAVISSFTRGVYPYLIKTNEITNGFNKQLNLWILQRLARYKRIVTTLWYVHITDSMVKDYFIKIQGKINIESNNRGDDIGYA